MEHENQCNKDDCFCRRLAVDMSGLFGHLLGSKLVQFRVGLVLKVFQHLNLGKLTPKHQAQVGTRSKILQNAEYAECFKKLRRYCTSRDASTWLDSFAENSPRGELLGFGQCCHSCSRRLVALESRMPLMTLMIRYDKHPCSAALPHCCTAALPRALPGHFLCLTATHSPWASSELCIKAVRPCKCQAQEHRVGGTSHAMSITWEFLIQYDSIWFNAFTTNHDKCIESTNLLISLAQYPRSWHRAQAICISLSWGRSNSDTKGIVLNLFFNVKSNEVRVNLSLVLSLAVVNDWFCIKLPVESTLSLLKSTFSYLHLHCVLVMVCFFSFCLALRDMPSCCTDHCAGNHSIDCSQHVGCLETWRKTHWAHLSAWSDV